MSAGTELPPAAVAGRRDRAFSGELRRYWAELALTGLAIGFVGLSVWWVSVDERIPAFDAAAHTLRAFAYHDTLANGDLLGPFKQFNLYPPLVHLVGAGGVALGGRNVAASIVAQNVVFVPLLLIGCYGAGRAAADKSTGLLAAVFAVAAPMSIGQFHVLMLDGPMTAMVALSVWLLLASDRFDRLGFSLAAGGAVGLGLMTKQTFIMFVAGLVATLLARGGYRNWRNFAAFAALAAAISLPWYVGHASAVIEQFDTGAASGPNSTVGTPSYERWTVENFTWYGWNMVNLQLLAPLTLFFVVGIFDSVRRWVVDRLSVAFTPELIAGGLVGYLAMTLIGNHSPRYTLPCLVYMAVLGTMWISRSRQFIRATATVVLVAVLVANTVAVTFGVGHARRISFSHAATLSGLHERQLTLLPPTGYDVDAPDAKGDRPQISRLLREVRLAGTRVVEFDPGSLNVPIFSADGLTVLASMEGLSRPPVYDPGNLGPSGLFLLRRALEPGGPKPCATLRDGSGVYLVRGSPLKPFEEYDLYCPKRSNSEP